MALTFNYLWLLVEDIGRAKSFYRDILGLEVLNDFGVFVEFNANENCVLACFERSAMQSAEPGLSISPASGQHASIEFEIETLDEFCAVLRTKGVQFASELKDHPEWGLRTAFLHDLDSNLLCLFKRIQMSG